MTSLKKDLRRNRASLALSTLWLPLLAVMFHTVSCWNIAQTTRRQWTHRGFLFAMAPEAVAARNLPDTTGEDLSRTGSLQTLIPLVRLNETLYSLYSDMQLGQHSIPEELLSRLGIPTNEKAFKSLFDAYSDPVSYKQRFVDQNAFLVYYSKGFDGPGRPAIEDDLPTKQTLQYGARNDAWLAWDEFLAENDYLNSHSDESEDVVRLLLLLSKCLQALRDYLALAPVTDLQKARATIYS